MRRAAGIVLIFLGVVEFAIYGIVMLHIPLPTLFFRFGGFGEFALFVDPVVAPISASLFLLGGILLLRRRSGRTASRA
jgi:hypothetical protein